MSNSKDGHTSVRDRLKLQFQDKEVAAFRMRLASYKSTLTIALEFSSFKSTSQNLEATKALEAKIEAVAARLTGQMQGLQIGLQAFHDASAQSQELVTTTQQQELAQAQDSKLLLAIEQQNIALGHCYRACMAALKETTQATGHTYKYLEASNEARMLAGDLGNVPGGSKNTYEVVLAKDKANIVVGNMEWQYAKDFFQR
ncbi:uncharacterized protein K444DRAFT_547107 [Hyaloscypha bicolor E]|uniref:Azaphilone pigments biosynthesis cluster protein L N-terminal domain-containing protein n=1 Tax=Hyaloscypha bicolor E TaxID=1095630 RepID=A0A2J6SI46_9HELO|nr:uncharacterized protein K444DRAFT_547107 [Hyaloscypha bicolor E]PMD50438.1 hypothetical protein K444DRAFT_547107 [Hyaloscypha bicolor E]